MKKIPYSKLAMISIFLTWYITKFISYNEYYPQILVNSSIPHIKNSGNIQVYITVVKLSVKY